MSNQDPNNPSPGGPGTGRDHQTPGAAAQPNTQGFRVAGQQVGPGRRERAQAPQSPAPSPQWPPQGVAPGGGGYAAQGLPQAFPTLTPASPAGVQYGAAGQLAFEPARDGALASATPVRAARGGAGFALPMPPTDANILLARVGACLGLLTFVVSFVVVALTLTQHNASIVYAAGAFVSLPISALFAYFFWQTAQFASDKQREPIRQAGQQRAGDAAPQPTFAPAGGAAQPRQMQRSAQPADPQPPVAPEAATVPMTPQEPPEYAPLPEQEPTIEAIPFKHLDPAQFEDHEPDKRAGDRVPHTASVAELGDGDWAVVGVSLRGLSHKHDAKFREDAIAGVTVGSWQLAVVADGGGAYHLSRVGSNVGARAALQGMRARLRDLARTPGATSAEGMNTVLRAGFSQAYEALGDEAKTRGVTPREMYTTLLLVAHLDLGHGKHLIGGAQVGDGAVVARMIMADGERRLIRLNTPDIGAANNETVFFQSVSPDDWQNRIFAQVVEGAQCYCLAMTDGITDDFTPLERELVRLEEPLFRDVLAGKKTPKDAIEAIESLLDYRRPGSFDDRSLVCIYNTRERPWK